MFLKLIEICDEVTYNPNTQGKKEYSLRDIVINSDYIIFMREDGLMESLCSNDKLPKGLRKEEKFTRITVFRGNVSYDFVVVGDLVHVSNLFQWGPKHTLRD